MALSLETIEKVNERLLKPFEGLPVKKTDVAILMGGRSTSGTVAFEGARLYHEGAFSKVVVAGGARIFQPEVFIGLILDKNPNAQNSEYLKDIFSLKTEADYMRKVLIERGVPEESIIMGDNTQKHADKIVSVLRENVMEQFSSATLMTYAPYLRRTVGTMRFQGVELPLDVRPINPFGITPDNWQDSKLAGIVVQEAHNMDPANENGYVGVFTTEVDLEEEARLRDQLPELAV